MKKLIISSMFALALPAVNAQNLGIKLGAGTNDFDNFLPSISITYEQLFNKYIGLVTGVGVTAREIYDNYWYNGGCDIKYKGYESRYYNSYNYKNSDYAAVNIPLAFEVKALLNNNFRFVFNAGGYMDWDPTNGGDVVEITHSHPYYTGFPRYNTVYETHNTGSYTINPIVFGFTSNIGFEYGCARLGVQVDVPLTDYNTQGDRYDPCTSLTLGFRFWGNKNFVRKSKIKAIPQNGYQIGDLQPKRIIKKTVIRKADSATPLSNTEPIEKTEKPDPTYKVTESVTPTPAQPTTLSRKKLQFGVKTGLNISSIIGMKESEGIHMKAGYHIGVLAEYAVNNLFSISPELNFSSQGYKMSYEDDGDKYKERNIFNYINIPVMAKFYVIKDLSIEAGPQFGFLLGAKSKWEEEYDGEKESGDESIKSKYRNFFDLGIGIGATYNLDNYFASARYNLGFTNILKTEGNSEYSNRNSVVQISLGYKF